MTNEPNLKCSYLAGPCVAMSNHSRSSQDGYLKTGIYALDNRVVLSNPSRFFHMGFAFKGSPDKRAKAGVILNHCPWCGEDLQAWMYACRADMALDKSTNGGDE